MKFLAIIAAVLAVVAAPVAAKTNDQKCNEKSRRVHIAIAMFCQDMGNQRTVPSTFTRDGKIAKKDGGQSRVTIQGFCSPAQWVPQDYCYKQFFQMCADGAKERRFGRDGCQTWTIDKNYHRG